MFLLQSISVSFWGWQSRAPSRACSIGCGTSCPRALPFLKEKWGCPKGKEEELRASGEAHSQGHPWWGWGTAGKASDGDSLATVGWLQPQSSQGSCNSVPPGSWVPTSPSGGPPAEQGCQGLGHGVYRAPAQPACSSPPYWGGCFRAVWRAWKEEKWDKKEESVQDTKEKSCEHKESPQWCVSSTNPWTTGKQPFLWGQNWCAGSRAALLRSAETEHRCQ